MTQLDNHAIAALSTVLDYLWDDELRDFAANPTDDHIFHNLLVLRNSLDCDDRTPQDYVAEEFDG